LPNETPDDMKRNMEAISQLAPENITIHTLAIKNGAENRAKIGKSEARVCEAQLSIAARACADMGLAPYYLYRQKNMIGLFENVGYSLPNYESLYNVGMMGEFQTVLGFGAGAVSKYVIGNKISRDFNPKNTEIYTNRILERSN